MPVADPDEPYRYRGSRPLPVFGLALFAAFIVYGATATTHAALLTAIDRGWIASPPGLKWLVANPDRDRGPRPAR